MGFNLGDLFGKVEVAVGNLLNIKNMKEDGLAKQQAASSKKTTHTTKASGSVLPSPVPPHAHANPAEELAAAAALGETLLVGGGGRMAM